MTPAQAHRRFEQLLRRAITSADPVAALQRAARERDLPVELRRALAQVDPDGLRMSALLVARLRFERLLRGCRDAESWFERDAAAFTEAFRRYHHDVPPTAFFPSAEGKLFRAWLAKEKGPLDD